MRAPFPVLLITAILAVVGGLVVKSSLQGPSPDAVTPAENPDHVQIDYQNKVKVVATFLPYESTPSEAKVKVEISSETVDLNSYPYQDKLVWADTNIYYLPTLKSEEISKTSDKLVVKMTFQRNEGSHYHFIVRDLAGVKDRVLHFYGL